MHISSNVSHWVCVLSGVLLIITGLLSHAHTRTAGLVLPGERPDAGRGALDTGSSGDVAGSGMGKRAVLVVVGVAAVAYGISRLIG